MKAFKLIYDRFNLTAFFDSIIALDAVNIVIRDQIIETVRARIKSLEEAQERKAKLMSQVRPPKPQGGAPNKWGKRPQPPDTAVPK